MLILPAASVVVVVTVPSFSVILTILEPSAFFLIVVKVVCPELFRRSERLFVLPDLPPELPELSVEEPEAGILSVWR